jgi:trk system potassium uptake protein TrkH
MPYLRVGGMQLFQMESSQKFNNIISDARKLAKIIFTVYISLTAVNFVAYYLAGMGLFDAINHALTTISTGGFSTHDLSFGYFESSKLEWIATFFMIAGGTPMLLYYIYFRGKRIRLPLISQAKFLYKGLFLTTIAMTIWLYFNSDFRVLDSIRMSAFNITSIVTTTGFATTDYSKWGNFIIMGFFLMTMMGGCAGSTSGGIKIFRIQILFKYLSAYINHLMQPREIYEEKIKYKWMNDELIKDTMIFMMVFLLVSLGLSLTGLDFITSLSGAATAIANVGPGLGEVIGPSGNFSSLPNTSKCVLIFAMLAGRLEILFIFVLFSKGFWIRKKYKH